MKRGPGRPKGTGHPLLRPPPVTDPLMLKLEPLNVGESCWIETDGADVSKVRSRLSTPSRFPRALHGRRFTQNLHVAVSTPGMPTYLVLRITRLQ